MRQKKSQNLPNKPVVYPAGTFLETEKGYFYIVNEAKRFHILTKRVLDSWSPHRIVLTTEAAVKRYRISARLKFRNGSLIYNYADAKIYLISEGKRRLVTNPDIMDRLGASFKDVIQVSQREIDLHEEGEKLS